jgi:Putative Flp pilus-assembly TadE/G-like
MTPRHRVTDEGSVLLLIMGLVVLAALFITVVMDVSALFLDRRDLIAAADGAALAGAQAVDAEALYVKGLPASGPLILDEDRARAAAEDYLIENGFFERYAGFAVQVQTTSTSVRVSLQALVQLPVTNAVTPGQGDGVQVRASATARSAVIG